MLLRRSDMAKVNRVILLMIIWHFDEFRQCESINRQIHTSQFKDSNRKYLLNPIVKYEPMAFARLNSVLEALFFSKLTLRGGCGSNPRLELPTNEKTYSRCGVKNAAHSIVQWTDQYNVFPGSQKNEVRASHLDTVQYLESESLRGNLYATALLKISRGTSFDPVNKSDEVDAFKLFARGSEKGNPVATLLLGQVFHTFHSRIAGEH
jgi:hypothetical protein